MSDNKSNGIGFGGVLTVLFVGLKLTGYIDWSWWWVTSPITIPIALVFAIVFIGIVIKMVQE
jgi:hypothetical protein